MSEKSIRIEEAVEGGKGGKNDRERGLDRGRGEGVSMLAGVDGRDWGSVLLAGSGGLPFLFAVERASVGSHVPSTEYPILHCMVPPISDILGWGFFLFFNFLAHRHPFSPYPISLTSLPRGSLKCR